ncbi:MAG: S8 family serine peptidase [Candidatus Sericytochromatia bacterium]|nr:S8 family serine peptidase [Candidatus Tanganyikabacteria bacterium]
MRGMFEAECAATSRFKGPVVIGVLDTGVDARHHSLAGVLASGLDFVGEDDRIARAVDAARKWQGSAGERVRILNLSIGGRTLSERLGGALRAAHAAGITIVAAFGNRGRGLDFPACLPEVLAVGATTADEGLAACSNRGPGLAFVAPGGDVNVPVWSAWPIHVGASDLGVAQPQTRDGGMMGTSMAAPHVAGLAARLLARRPDLGQAELRRELGRYLVDLGPPGPDAWFGAGLPLWSHVPADGRR